MEMTSLSHMAACLLPLLFATCSASDSDEASPKDTGAKTRHLVITQTADDATRATLTDDGTTLAAAWTKGDGLAYWNFTEKQEFDAQTSRFVTKHDAGSLTATTTAATSQFEGSVTCSEGDYLAVIYPAATVNNAGAYTLTLSGQDGTLATLAQRYHYVYGVAHVTGVTETTATATMGKMKSLLTVCKFAFTDGTNAIPIETLTISYGGNDSWTGKYPQTATVTCNSTQADVTATAETSSEPLTVTLTTESKEAYVALVPVIGRDFNFTVTNGSGTYTGTATATLNAGEYVVATGLKLTKQ